MLSTKYDLSGPGLGRLDTLISRISANPGTMVQPLEVERAMETLTLRPALDSLPPGMTAADLIGALKLAIWRILEDEVMRARAEIEG